MPARFTSHFMAPDTGGAGGNLLQPSSTYRYRAGGCLVTAVHEGHNPVPLKEGFVRNVPLEDMQAALAEACLPTETLNITFTPITVETSNELVLIDAGFADNGPPTTGFLARHMAAAGMKPEDVTKVVISHFHGDHITGLRKKNGEEVYPNAEMLVPEVEWDFWTDSARRSEAPEGMKPNFANVERVFGPIADRVVKYKWDDEVVPGIRALDARGHTPGHTAFTIGSGPDRLVFIADVTNHPALFVRNPDWAAAFDIDPDAARQTRHRILGMIADEKLLCAGYHLPFPAVGGIVRDAKRFRFCPTQWMTTV